MKTNAKRDWNLVGRCAIVYAHGNFLFKVLLIAQIMTQGQRGREGLPTKVRLRIRREGQKFPFFCVSNK